MAEFRHVSERTAKAGIGLGHLMEPAQINPLGRHSRHIVVALRSILRPDTLTLSAMAKRC
jgi:hypothetical protein